MAKRKQDEQQARRAEQPAETNQLTNEQRREIDREQEQHPQGPLGLSDRIYHQEQIEEKAKED